MKNKKQNKKLMSAVPVAPGNEGYVRRTLRERYPIRRRDGAVITDPAKPGEIQKEFQRLSEEHFRLLRTKYPLPRRKRNGAKDLEELREVVRKLRGL